MQSFMLISLLLAGACLAEIEIGNYLNNFNDVPLVKKRCEEKGKPDSYDRLKVAVNDTRTCFDGKVNPGHLKDELEEAKKTGSMDEVFGKYCNKRQQYKDCILKTVNVAKECLEESESSAIDTLIRITDNVLDFACYRDGDRLAMFVAEGGPECVTSRTEQIKNCINATLKIDTTNLTLENIPENLPTLTINKEKCDKLVEVQECVVKDLETNCKDTTPANIVEALFKFVKKTACNNIKQKRSFDLNRNLDMLKMINSSLLYDKLAKECQKTGNGQALTNFWVALYAEESCSELNRIFVLPKEEYLRKLKQCTEPHIKKLEDCLSETYKFYPKFVNSLAESLINFLYQHMNFKTLTPKSDLVNCLQRIKSVGGIQSNLLSCLKNRFQNETFDFENPDRTAICKLLGQVNDCIRNFVNNTCVADIAVDTVLGNFTLAIEAPCSNITN